MKALIICSVHALCDFSPFERKACNRTCERHGIPAFLAVQDHARLLARTTMLGVLNHLPGAVGQHEALIDSYLDFLNDEIWSASIRAYNSIFAALLDPQGYARPTGFVSDYPMLTTNLVRSSALLTNATKLGTLTALSDPLKVQRIAAGLSACATSLSVAHNDIDVLVANQRDFAAAQSIGMHPRFVKELRSEVSLRMIHCHPNAHIPAGTIIKNSDLQAFAVPA